MHRLNLTKRIATGLVASIASIASIGAAIAFATPAIADTRIANLNLDQSPNNQNNQSATVTCLNDGEFYSGMVDACETLSEIEINNPTLISFAVDSDRVTTPPAIQADKIITIDPAGQVACFIPANGSVDGTVSCGLIGLD
ncbi:hypothetical protein Pse7367_1418 [Thalassoporum mexicanum PCC 7367]|uniref:hypothetical protein n=1 Tax=Thalassoporum mexicanum TaxID=3457544 RepID=UPI00029FE188|nr:hypothetical protein [Pseudanabaena sp. PCC 7367]AFY69709.1 hypothetical protein Pse7367_1418 [Pseudanabaena sp. PCC 7367]